MSSKTKEPKLTPMDENPIAAFNLNVTGLNPDVEIDEAKEYDLLPTEDIVASTGLMRELYSPMHITDPVSRMKFEVLHLNRHSQARPIVMTISWSTDLTHSGNLNEARLVATMTGRPVWVIANPNTARSSILNKAMRKKAKKVGFQEIAACMLRALRAQDITEVDLEGTSMGGLLASFLAVNAPQYNITVHTLVVVDAPGMIKQNRISLVRSFMREKPNLERYSELTSCNQQDQGESETFFDFIKYYVDLAKHGFRTNFLIYPSVMARCDLIGCIGIALFDQMQLRVVMICGTSSNISQHDKILGGMYGILRLANSTRGRFRLNLLPGDTHALGAGNRIAWYITQALK